VQVPLQIVVERDAGPDQSLAVIDQQPQIELDAGQLGGRQVLDAFAQRCPGDGQRVDAIGLAALAASASRLAHQLGRDAEDALAVADQEPLQRAGHVPAVLQRPDSLVVECASPVEQLQEPLVADPDRCVVDEFARGRGDRRDRVRALVRVRPEHHHPPCPPVRLTDSWTLGGHGLLEGAATLLSSHAEHPGPTTSDIAKGSQAHRPTA
jgi:hypothetical protein